MNKSEKEIHEGTEYLQHLADEVERERAERGRANHDVTVAPEEEEPEHHDHLSGDGATIRPVGPTA